MFSQKISKQLSKSDVSFEQCKLNGGVIFVLSFPILHVLVHYSPYEVCVFHGKANTEALTASFNTAAGQINVQFIPDATRAQTNFNYKHVKFNGAVNKSVGMLFLYAVVTLVMLC